MHDKCQANYVPARHQICQECEKKAHHGKFMRAVQCSCIAAIDAISHKRLFSMMNMVIFRRRRTFSKEMGLRKNIPEKTAAAFDE